MHALMCIAISSYSGWKQCMLSCVHCNIMSSIGDTVTHYGNKMMMALIVLHEH